MPRSINTPCRSANQECGRDCRHDRTADVMGHQHLHAIGRVGAKHHQLAMRHIHDTMTPKLMARPMAASTRTDSRLNPNKSPHDGCLADRHIPALELRMGGVLEQARIYNCSRGPMPYRHFLHKTGARAPRCVLKQGAACIRNPETCGLT
jgi:hypothetical protein